MKKVLVISDDELLSQLYLTNLEVYLDSKVLLATSLSNAEEVLDFNSDFKLIITLTSIKDVNVLEGLKELLILKKKIIIPIIAVGDSGVSASDDQIIEVKNYYSVQSIIKAAAKTLGVTAKEMINVAVPKFYPIDLDFFKKMKLAPSNLYVEIKKDHTDSEFVIFANKGSTIDKLIHKLQKDGVAKLFVNANDRLSVVNSVSISICEALTMKNLVNNSDRSELLATSLNFVASSIVSSEISNEIVGLAHECTKVMTDVVNDTPDLKSLLQIFLKNKNGFNYMHSMLSAYVASHIVKKVPWGGESHLEKINFVLFFHDIPLAPIYEKFPTLRGEEDLLFSSALSDQEKEIVLNHARMSSEMVSGLKRCPMGADLLIKQHHGMGNGIGFAIEFRDDISPLSKIIIVSEAFIEEFFRLKDSSSDGVKVNNIIVTLKERFPKHTYKKIIETLNTLKI